MSQKVENMDEIHGTMTGDRAVMVAFVDESGARYSVTFDFYGSGREFNGAEYRQIESAALRAVVASGRKPRSWTAYVIR